MEPFDDNGVPEDWGDRIATIGRAMVSAFACVAGAATFNAATTGNIVGRFNLLSLTTWGAIAVGGEVGRNAWRATVNVFNDDSGQQG